MRQYDMIAALAAALLAACSESSAPTGAEIPARAPPAAVVASATATAGIPYGPFHLADTAYHAPYTGAVRDFSSPRGLLKGLNAARAAHMHLIVRIAGAKRYYQNSDGSFSLDMWKSRVAVYSGLDLSGYVADGTLLGHFLFDEPHDKTNWNGQPVPFSDVEGAAQYSKQLWPYLTTAIRSPMSFLQGKTDWVYLDAGWEQYSANDGSAAAYIDGEAALAQRLGLGVVGGMNVLNGGTGESGIPGYTSGKWAMSAREVQDYGSAILANSAVCGFLMWKWDQADPSYFQRADVQQAAAALGQAAGAHAATPCRVH